MPTPQDVQTHSNNSSAFADELFEVFDHFVGLALNGLTDTVKLIMGHVQVSRDDIIMLKT